MGVGRISQHVVWDRTGGRITPEFGALIVASVLALCAAAPPAAATPLVPDNAYGIHSMLQVSAPYAFKQQMFFAAATAGASEIRVDVSLGALSLPWISSDMWKGVDQYMALSQQYGIRVLIDLNASNDPRLETCQPGADPSAGLCGVTDLTGYYSEVAALVQHVRGVIDDFEIVNEPDGEWAFTGTPQQYAGMLATAYAAVHDNDPAGRVVLGGIMTLADQSWLSQVFATPEYDAAQKFDIANVHLRGPLASLPPAVLAWRSFFAAAGDGALPLWVTETGYPADPAYQPDYTFRGTDQASGEAAQAAFLAQSLPAMLFAGATKVFVTERDNLTGQFASEGLIGGQVGDNDEGAPHAVVRPAYYVFSALAHGWPPPPALANGWPPPAPASTPPASPSQDRRPPPPPRPAHAAASQHRAHHRARPTAARVRPRHPARSRGRAVRRSRGRASPSGRGTASRGHRSRTTSSPVSSRTRSNR